MNEQDHMRHFIKECIGEYPKHPDIDLFDDLGISGDDCSELMMAYAEKYGVDMDNYLWYFHQDEEGFISIGGLFFKPPNERVKRIPITPNMLLHFSHTKKWDLDYPDHQLPAKRYDFIINRIIALVLFIIISVILLLKYKIIG